MFMGLTFLGHSVEWMKTWTALKDCYCWDSYAVLSLEL